MNELLTVKEAAAEIRVSKITIKRWIHKGTLSAVKISERGDFRIKREDLDNLMKKMTYEN